VIVCANKQHHDFIRAVDSFKLNGSNFVAGSLDSIVKLYDIRTHELVQAEFPHSFAVSSVAVYNSDTFLATSSGKEILLWDMRNTAEPLHKTCQNIKNISEIEVFEDEKRLISASADGHLKIFELENVRKVNKL